MHTSISNLELKEESKVARMWLKESLVRLQSLCLTFLKEKYLGCIIPGLVFVTRISEVVKNLFTDGKPSDLQEVIVPFPAIMCLLEI